jgi:flagellar hook-associated protein 2
MTGLSGIDTESMIAAMMKAEGLKLTRLQSQNQVTLWTQSAYQNVSSVMKNFQSSFLNLNSPTSGRLTSSYVKNTVSVSSGTAGKEATGIKVIGSANAVPGEYSMKVLDLAKADKYVGDQKSGSISSSIDWNSSDIIDSLTSTDAEGNTTYTSFDVTLDGLTKSIKFNAEDITKLTAENKGSDRAAKLEEILQKKLNNAFGEENVAGTDQSKISVSMIGGKLSFQTPKGHTASVSGADLEKLGISAGASTKFNTSSTLGDFFKVVGDLSFNINGKKFEFSETTTVADMMSQINKANIGVSFTYDSVKQNFSLDSTSTGLANAINIEDSTGANLNFLTSTLGLSNDENKGGTKAQDSRFIFNGVETTREGNRIEIAGLTMDLTDKTNEALKITVEKDSSSTTEFVKKFVDAYNTMLDGLNKELSTSRPKRDSYNYYDPLTEEEKSAMSDTDIANWEAQAKKGLLYNDSILSDVASQLRSSLYLPVELENGKKLSLYDIGITFSNSYTDRGKLVIDEDKLSAAINANGDSIATLFTKSSSLSHSSSNKPSAARLEDEGIAERMNDIINSATSYSGSISVKAGIPGDQLSELSSTMYRTIKEQNTRISEMMVYLQNKEASYYTMFSKMEQAITSSNNQMAYLSASLGM